MNGSSIRAIFPKKLMHYMSDNGKSRNDLVRDLGFKYSTVRDWEKGITIPRMDKVEMLANYFGIQKSDLIEEKMTEEKEKDNEILADIIVRMRSDVSFFAIVEALVMDKEFFAAVKALHNLEPDKSKGVQDMLKAFGK